MDSLIGRIFTTPRGLFGIRLNDGTEVLGPNGEGLTKEVAERVLDAIETRNCRSALVVPASPLPLSGAGV